MRFSKGMALILGGAALALVVSGCGKAAAPAGPAQQVELVMDAGFKFNPPQITVAAGQPVKLKVQNKDSVLHDWSIDKIAVAGKKEKSSGDHGMAGMAKEPDLHISVDAGRSGDLDFTPKDKGRYEFYCTVPGHRDAGMKGTLVVQ